jgi:HTH-type transcriptional regulator/antitoxin HigA
MSATLVVDPKKYTRLANRVVVKAIETEDEYDRMVAAVEHLMDKGEDNLSPEESAFLETMAILVQAYEDRYHPLPPVAPNEMLAYLMETSGRTYQDLLPVLGTRGRVSEALGGKRSISQGAGNKTRVGVQGHGRSLHLACRARQRIRTPPLTSRG